MRSFFSFLFFTFLSLYSSENSNLIALPQDHVNLFFEEHDEQEYQLYELYENSIKEICIALQMPQEIIIAIIALLVHEKEQSNEPIAYDDCTKETLLPAVKKCYQRISGILSLYHLYQQEKSDKPFTEWAHAYLAKIRLETKTTAL